VPTSAVRIIRRDICRHDHNDDMNKLQDIGESRLGMDFGTTLKTEKASNLNHEIVPMDCEQLCNESLIDTCTNVPILAVDVTSNPTLFRVSLLPIASSTRLSPTRANTRRRLTRTGGQNASVSFSVTHKHRAYDTDAVAVK